MKTIDAVEAESTLDSLLDLVEQGEEITITRHGGPVARLTTARADIDRDSVRSVIAGIKAMRKGVTLGGIPVKSLIEDGRR